MGLILDFRLNYLSTGAHRETHDGVVCYITVRAHAAWNSNVEVQKLLLPELSSIMTEHQVYMYGVTPRFTIEGDFRYISHTPIMTWVIATTVLLALPAVLMRYVVEFTLGVPSSIYRRETCRTFDIYDHLRETQARMLSSHAAYSVLSKNATLDKDSLDGYLKALYDLQLRDGTLQQEELDRLWRATMTGFDTDRSGKISLPEFVAAASMMDDLHMEDIVHFLDTDRKLPCLEFLLDSTRHQLRQQNLDIQRVSPYQNSPRADENAEVGDDGELPKNPVPHQDCQISVKSEKAHSIE